MDNGQWTMDNGQWTMDNGQWTIAVAKVHVKSVNRQPSTVNPPDSFPAHHPRRSTNCFRVKSAGMLQLFG